MVKALKFLKKKICSGCRKKIVENQGLSSVTIRRTPLDWKGGGNTKHRNENTYGNGRKTFSTLKGKLRDTPQYVGQRTQVFILTRVLSRLLLFVANVVSGQAVTAVIMAVEKGGD
ncbi:unnamed protein product [Ceratitis capitata]|uniref:(Mediterranean fruit fly) hypothetical protein n=1 Tax=Ceratitis capitata TaxID=7213 RepID=A0A811V8A0_CERCA|nr:unnamed protein product [Ceratitis capitata]